MDFCHRATHLDELGMPDEFGRQFHCANEFQECMFRVGRGENCIGYNLFATCQQYTFRHLVFHTDFCYFCISSDFPSKGFHSICQSSCNLSRFPNIDMCQPTAIEPIMYQCITSPSGHGTKGISMNGDRSNCCFQML